MTTLKRRSSLASYVDEAGGLPRDVLLGHIVFFKVCDGEYDRDQIAKWFSDLNLNVAYVPNADLPVNAFRKATSDFNGTTYTLPGTSNVATILVRDVAKDDQSVVRHLVREIRDSAKRRLSHDKIGDATFWRGKPGVPGSERVKVYLDDSALVSGERPLALAVVDSIAAAYDRYAAFMDDMKIRAMLRNYLSYLNAVSIKPSVYFVHTNRADELGQLQELVKRIGNGCSLNLIPLVDLAEQRDMVVEAFQTEAVQALEAVVSACANLRSTRKTISADAYAKVKADFDQVMSQATEYTRVLDVTQDRTAGAAEMALESLHALQRQFIADSSKGATP